MDISINALMRVIEKHAGTVVDPLPREGWITGVSSIANSKPGTLTWMRDQTVNWDDILSSVVICSDQLILPETKRIVFIPVPDPRLVFAKVLSEILAGEAPKGISPTAKVSQSAHIGDGVSIGHGSYVGRNVCIGERTIIGHHVVIRTGTAIGRDCTVKSNTVIGEKGFGFAFEKDGTPVAVPQIGGVVIGDHVEIGALNTVASGSIDPTMIADYVKTDDHVHIAHNVVIGKNTIITACVELSGGVTIGENVWIGPNVSVKEKLAIGSNALIGIGAVVIRDVAAGTVVAGNPASFLKRRQPYRRA